MIHNRRNAKRPPFQQTAFIDAGEGTPLVQCIVMDISVTGCRISEVALPLPSEFSLALTRDGTVRRHCRVTWTEDREVRITFVPAPETFQFSCMSAAPTAGGTTAQPQLLAIDC